MSSRSTVRRLGPALVAAVAGVLLVLLAPPAAARVEPMVWHRLDTGLDGHTDPPGHEVLHCVTDGQWRCTYMTRPGPGLTDSPYRAVFEGTDVTDGWECPAWLSADVCDSVDQVVAGTQTFFNGRAHETFTVPIELLISEDGTLWVHWPRTGPEFEPDPRPFACPWYPTFEQARQESAGCQTPTPLP